MKPQVQLNKYKTDPYFFKNFQSTTIVSSIIHSFGKVYERENVFLLIYRTARAISCSQLLQKNVDYQTNCLIDFEENTEQSRIHLAILKF